MACTVVRPAPGVAAIVCRRGQRRPKCSVCRGVATLECDFPKGRGTCDAALCRRCAVRLEGGIDYCPSHEQRALI